MQRKEKEKIKVEKNLNLTFKKMRDLTVGACMGSINDPVVCLALIFQIRFLKMLYSILCGPS